MEQRFTLLTLAVADLAASIAFYERLGWRRSVRETDGIAFFQCGCAALALYPRDKLADDVGLPAEGTGYSGVTIAFNAHTREEVDAVLAEAEAAWATIVKPAQEVFWGGYSGYFRDLDGHLWEVAHNPFFPLDDKGAVTLPD